MICRALPSSVRKARTFSAFNFIKAIEEGRCKWTRSRWQKPGSVASILSNFTRAVDVQEDEFDGHAIFMSNLLGSLLQVDNTHWCEMRIRIYRFHSNEVSIVNYGQTSADKVGPRRAVESYCTCILCMLLLLVLVINSEYNALLIRQVRI